MTASKFNSNKIVWTPAKYPILDINNFGVNVYSEIMKRIVGKGKNIISQDLY